MLRLPEGSNEVLVLSIVPVRSTPDAVTDTLPARKVPLICVGPLLKVIEPLLLLPVVTVPVTPRVPAVSVRLIVVPAVMPEVFIEPVLTEALKLEVEDPEKEPVNAD